jgi:hypothetical protein
MAGTKTEARKARLAAALKENLKRRKTQARSKANSSDTPEAQELGKAPQSGPEDMFENGPKFAPNGD